MEGRRKYWYGLVRRGDILVLLNMYAVRYRSICGKGLGGGRWAGDILAYFIDIYAIRYYPSISGKGAIEPLMFFL